MNHIESPQNERSDGSSEVGELIQAWLRETLPPDWPECGKGEWVTAWQRRFFEDRWATPTWPTHLGGRGLSAREAATINLALAAVDAPVPYNMVTVLMLGAALLAHATPEQQLRLMPDLAARRVIWCQMFSEPGAGSDLTSLSTKAVRDGDQWVLTGQKVWSSFGAEASFGLVLARTDPTLPKNEGITAFALPMKTKGVGVHPIRQITGDADFCEVFLDEVVVSDDNRIGQVNRGWDVARSMLSAERTMLGGEGASPVAHVGGIDVETLLASGLTLSAMQRDQLLNAVVRDRVVAMLSSRVGRDPKAAPLVKVAQAMNNQRLQELAATLVGPGVVANNGDGLAATVGFGLLRSRANTIGGGTSEVLRTIIGESMLGLPREPDPYRGKPWTEIPRS